MKKLLNDLEQFQKEKIILDKKIIEAEEKIFKKLKEKNFISKTEGQETLHNINGFSVVVNQPMNYKIDDKKYRALCEILPEDFQFHRVKLEIDKKQYDIVRGYYPQQVSDCVTCKPGKISIKIEIEKEEN